MFEDKAVAIASGGEVTQGFGEVALRQQSETAASAVAERERAALQAKYIMAERRPRDVERFRLRLVADCKRPGFAEVAKYSRPVGGGNTAEGPSIRFVEAALRAYGNTSAEVSTVFDNERLRILRVTVIDYEVNTGYSIEIPVAKAVEKRGDNKGNPPTGRTVISSRINSAGHATYLVEATEDEVIVRQAALVSKAIRTQGLRILPGDIVEEAMGVVEATLQNPGEDRAKTIRTMIDAFAEQLNIGLEQLREWNEGRDLMTLNGKQIAELKKIGAAIREGHARWEDFMEAKDPAGSVEAAEAVKEARLAALRGNRVTTTTTAANVVNSGGGKPSGSAETEARTDQPATSAAGTESGAPASFATVEQVEQIKEILNKRGLDVAAFFKSCSITDSAKVPANMVDTLIAMAKAAKVSK